MAYDEKVGQQMTNRSAESPSKLSLARAIIVTRNLDHIFWHSHHAQLLCMLTLLPLNIRGPMSKYLKYNWPQIFDQRGGVVD